MALIFSTDTNGSFYRPATINGTDYSTTGDKSRWGGNPNLDAANTLMATGMSGNLTVNLPIRNGRERGSVSGIQIIQVPEPSTSLLGGLAGMMMLLRRRR